LLWPTRAPQPPQNRESGAFSVPQLEQRIPSKMVTHCWGGSPVRDDAAKRLAARHGQATSQSLGFCGLKLGRTGPQM
jgi:hypothetical protein